MSPRVKPKNRPADDVAAARRAALDRGVQVRSTVSEREAEASYERVIAAAQIDPVPSPEPYGPGPHHSWFMDQAFAHASPETMRGTILPPLVDLQAARSRLAVVQGLERRDLTTTVTDGGNFVPSGVPGFIGDAFAAAVRTAARRCPGILPVRDLRTRHVPQGPRITTGATTAVHGTREHVGGRDGPRRGVGHQPDHHDQRGVGPQPAARPIRAGHGRRGAGNRARPRPGRRPGPATAPRARARQGRCSASSP